MTDQEWDKKLAEVIRFTRKSTIDECISQIVNNPTMVLEHIEGVRIDVYASLLAERQHEIIDMLIQLKEEYEISEEKCTWNEKRTPFGIYYKINCGYSSIFGNIRPNYICCPGCGREIEWVEDQQNERKDKTETF